MKEENKEVTMNEEKDGMKDVQGVIRQKRTLLSLWRVAVLLFICILLLGPILYFLHMELGLMPLIRILPSDESMIKHFHKHREDFEKMVKIFRYDFSVPFDAPSQCLIPSPEVQSIMERSGIDALCADSDYWIPPDPYEKNARFNTKETSYRENRAIEFIFERGYLRRMDGNFTLVRKYYLYIPVIPITIDERRTFKLSDGKEVYADGLLKRPIEIHFLYKSLSDYPSIFMPGECVYRRIEPQWFIGMCHLGN